MRGHMESPLLTVSNFVIVLAHGWLCSRRRLLLPCPPSGGLVRGWVQVSVFTGCKSQCRMVTRCHCWLSHVTLLRVPLQKLSYAKPKVQANQETVREVPEKHGFAMQRICAGLPRWFRQTSCLRFRSCRRWWWWRRLLWRERHRWKLMHKHRDTAATIEDFRINNFKTTE